MRELNESIYVWKCIKDGVCYGVPVKDSQGEPAEFGGEKGTHELVDKFQVGSPVENIRQLGGVKVRCQVNGKWITTTSTVID